MSLSQFFSNLSTKPGTEVLLLGHPSLENEFSSHIIELIRMHAAHYASLRTRCWSMSLFCKPRYIGSEYYGSPPFSQFRQLQCSPAWNELVDFELILVICTWRTNWAVIAFLSPASFVCSRKKNSLKNASRGSVFSHLLAWSSLALLYIFRVEHLILIIFKFIYCISMTWCGSIHFQTQMATRSFQSSLSGITTLNVLFQLWFSFTWLKEMPTQKLGMLPLCSVEQSNAFLSNW